MSEWFLADDPASMPVSRLLPRAGAAVARHVERAAGELGLTTTSLGVLGVLADRDGLSHRELAAGLGRTPATLTPVLDALEAGGEVRRTRDAADRRVVRLSITAAGRQRWETAAARVAQARAAVPHPPPDQVEIVRGYLLAVLAAVDDRGPRT